MKTVPNFQRGLNMIWNRMHASWPREQAIITGFFLFIAAFIIAISLAIVSWIERTTLAEAHAALTVADRKWIGLSVSGLELRISGEAPDRNAHAAALFRVESRISAKRIVDISTLAPKPAISVPTPRLYAIRDDDDIVLIGSVPAPDALLGRIRRTLPRAAVINMMTGQEHIGVNWSNLTRLAIEALSGSNRVSVLLADDSDVVIFVEDYSSKRELEAELRPLIPKEVPLNVVIEAPRDQIRPFRFRLRIESGTAILTVCHIESELDRSQLTSLIKQRFGAVDGNCTVGLGAPTDDWPFAIQTSVDSLFELGGGEIDMFGTQVRVMPLEATSASTIDRVIGELSSRLPEPYTVELILPQSTADSLAEQNRYILVARKSIDGELNIHGVMPDAATRHAVLAYAEAVLGRKPNAQLTLDDSTPSDLIEDVLIGLDALGTLDSGELTVQVESLTLVGKSSQQGADRVIESRLSAGLRGDYFRADIAFDPGLAALPERLSDLDCLNLVRGATGSRKISFQPGSTELTLDSLVILNSVAEAIEECEHVEFEVAGYTDSQGREAMNLRLSQRRAESVINALLSGGTLTSNLVAKGYGEADPIADNDTEEGREKNRRIEFRLRIQTQSNGPR